jgi:hypothetical protein
MSEITASESYIFNTDIGNTVVEILTVKGYDVEDIVSDKAFSQAQILRFQAIANNIDVNALMGTRAIKSAYLTGG